MRESIAIGFLALLMTAGAPVHAQETEDYSRLFAHVRAYYQGGDYNRAEQALLDIVDENPDNARAHYLLSRLYFDSPLKDLSRSSDELNRALEIEPDNVQYMVARLQFLQRDATNFIVERIRDAKRRTLAHEILEIDSTNSVAHEVLGVTYIHDFWRYRNAVSMPFFDFRGSTGTGSSYLTEQTQDYVEPDVGNTGAPAGPEMRPDLEGSNMDFQPADIFVADRFDLEAMRQQGVMVLDLSGRADYAYNRAIEHLETALKYDPRRRTVYDHLMEIYVLHEEPQKALDMLGSMYVQYPEDPELWLYLGYAHYRSHNLDAASESFETAFEYLEPGEYEAYHSLDLLLVGEQEELYHEDPAGYAERYWTSKDPRYLTGHNERKLEHYARLVYADLLYGAPDISKRGWETQRGRILIRYGVPPVDVMFTMEQYSGGLGPTEGGGASWSNFLMGGNVINVWDYGDFRFVFEDPFRNREFRLYSPSATDIASGAALPFQNDYVLLAKATFREVPDRYEYEAPGRAVDLPYLVNTFRGADGQTLVYVHYGVPITETVEPGGVLGVTLNVGTFLIGPNRNILASDESTVYGLRQSQMASFEDVTLWTATRRMTVRPGDHELSMEFEAGDGSAVGEQRREITAPDYSTDELLISDMLLAYGIEVTPDGEPLSAGAFVREGLSIRPAPWSVFSNEQPIYIYFEAYNLQRDASGQTQYEVEAILVPKDESPGIVKFFKGLFGDERGVSVQYDGTGTTPDASQYLILDAEDREPGLYTLAVQVRDTNTGETARTERDLYLE